MVVKSIPAHITTFLRHPPKANLPQHPEDKKFQFDVLTEDGVQLGFMLNTDMELAFDLDVNKTAGTQCIVHKTCKAALTMPLVKTYSEVRRGLHAALARV